MHKNTKYRLALAVVLILTILSNALGKNIQKDKKMETTQQVFNTIFPKGEEFKSDYFTGRVWLYWLVKKDNVFNCPMANVTFEPGCRNNWHKHPGGQLLLVTAGEGYYQEEGKPIQLLQPGDVVKIAPNVKHWHGATPISWFAHIAVEVNTNAGPAEWLEKVSDTDYDSYKAVETTSVNEPQLTKAAIKNHEELWPGYQSKAKETDPELIQVFDNFAFDDVIKYGNLDTKTRVMMILGSTIACQAQSEYKMMMNAALNVGVTPVEVKEILYQSVPYVGIAKVIDFVYLTNEILAERGIKLPLKGQSTTTPENRMEKGLALQKEIFGDMIDTMYKQSPANQLHIQQYLSANCFGDYYTRKGLDVKNRELLTYSMLISMGGTESQVKGHIVGNVAVGNNKETLLSVTTQLLPYIGYPRTLNALRCLNEVLPE
ncbi:MAG: carboxymuconolactone decarboxylase family protein [Bacteroidota bacterium]|nr:carboxymuconolactone decarboxylase family protein [Bacteroidota bacterium]